MRQEKQPLPGRGTPSPRFLPIPEGRKGVSLRMLLRAEWPSQEHRRNDAPFPCSGFTGLPPRFFSVHIKSMPPGTEFSGGKGSPFRYGAKKHNKQKVHLQGINRPPHRAEAAAANPFYCTRIVCSISSFRRGAVMPPTISFSFIPSRYRTVRGTASRPYLRAMSG